jgi:hypothetical protein
LRWWNRFEPLGCPEFHLYDREVEPQSAERQTLIARINSRPHCQARLTTKRSLENYLHPEAIKAAGGGEVRFSEDDNVADTVARAWLKATAHVTAWNQLTTRSQQRLRYRAKRWLNTLAADRMTAALLAERAPLCEVCEWLTTTISLAEPE